MCATNLITPSNQTNHVIEDMLKERNLLWRLLLRLSKNQADRGVKKKKLFDTFRQVLIDYVATGHFGLYERIIRGRRSGKIFSQKPIKFYPRIIRATKCVLAFDRRYSAKNIALDSSELKRDLSRISRELSDRIELEDQLIKLLQ